jgi:ribosomal protein S14
MSESLNCAECGVELTPDNTVRYDSNFAVCRTCEKETADN